MSLGRVGCARGRWIGGPGIVLVAAGVLGPASGVARAGVLSPAMGESDRREIGLAIEAFHAQGWDSRNVTCVAVDHAPEHGHGRTGAEFNWTPWAFAARIDPSSGPSSPPLAGRLDLLRRYGYLERIDEAAGVVTYGMTWQGFAASDGRGCYRIASDERVVTVHGEARSPRPGVRGVSATATPVAVEPIVRDPLFRTLFPTAAENVADLARPAIYGVGRYEGRLIVLASKTHDAPLPAARPEGARREPRPSAAEIARQVGPLDAARVHALILDRLTNPAPLMHAPLTRVCLHLPTAVDEHNANLGLRPPGVPLHPQPLWFTLYNMPRVGGDRHQREAYALLVALEAAGLARSRLLPTDRFRGQPTQGAVRFEMTPEGMALMDQVDPLCLRIGSFVPDPPLQHQPFTASRSNPRFAGRATFRPAPGAVPLIRHLPFLESLQRIGGAYRGELSVRRGGIDVELSFELVRTRLDVDGVRLPETR